MAKPKATKPKPKAASRAAGRPKASKKVAAKAKPAQRPQTRTKPKAAIKAKAKPKAAIKAKAKPKPPSKPAAKRATAGSKRATTGGSLKAATKASPAKSAPAAKPVSRAKPPAPKPKPKPRKPVFDAKTLRSIKEKLIAQQEELQEELREIEEAAFASSQSEISGEVGYDDQDYADSGSATFEREKDLSIANNVVDMLDKIRKALLKIDEGTYGICESCGDPIDLARLKALPNVLLCIRCKKAEERR